jgi:hypothetical protein
MAELNASRLFKPVTFGNTLVDASAQSFTNRGIALKPYAPVHLGSGRNSNGSVDFFWRRRTRVGAGWFDGVDVPLGEGSEIYSVNIYSDVTHSSSLASIAVYSEIWNMSKAILNAAYGSPTPSVGQGHWGVKQVGSVGYGYESFGTF